MYIHLLLSLINQLVCSVVKNVFIALFLLLFPLRIKLISSHKLYPNTFSMQSKIERVTEQFLLFFKLWIRGKKKVHFMTLLPCREAVIYEPTQVNGQLHLRCSVRQMGRKYSKSSRRAGIIRSARLMCPCGPGQMILKVFLMGGGAPWQFDLPFFGSNNLVPCWSLFWLMFICSVEPKRHTGK